MKLRIEIDMDNAAFAEISPGHEAARVLERAARIAAETPALDPLGSWRLRDSNGNQVGHLTISEE
jgi:hypothetical protein